MTARLHLTVSKPPKRTGIHTHQVAMNTYQVIYRLNVDEDSYHFIKADDAEAAAYNALDFVQIHKYKLLDVKRIKFR